jgi:murein DD-endopeptidase MepM/ murein hydrolase activator NlpD
VRPLLILLAPVAAVGALMGALVLVLVPGNPSAATSAGCLVAPPNPATDVDLDAIQRSVAATVITVGRQLGVPARGWVIALAAGLQESGLRPLPYGDRDSVGVFQQRTGWGTRAERIDPRAAATMFYTGGHGGQPGLLDIDGWQSMPLTQAAQAVQVSAYPDAYAKWEPLAVRLVADLASVDTGCTPPAGGWVLPLGGAAFTLTAGFGDCGAHWVHCHTGQDFAVPAGTPVVAVGAGVVTFAGTDGPYGNAIHLLHAGQVATWYAHLSRIDVTPGQRVQAGQVVGLSGATGNVTGPHLHLEVREHATPTAAGTPVDPLAWLHAHGLV